MRNILNNSGLAPHEVDFRIEQIDPAPKSTYSLESRQLLHTVYVTPVYPLARTEFALGQFRCVGCIVKNGIKEWGPLGCPVHTPSQSWPIRDALEVIAAKTAKPQTEPEQRYYTSGICMDPYCEGCSR